MGKFDKVLQIKVILPPLEMYCLFHITNLLQNPSSTPSSAVTELSGAPKGRPEYMEGRLPILQPISKAKSSKFSTLPIGINLFLSKFILKLEMTSNHINNQ